MQRHVAAGKERAKTRLGRLRAAMMMILNADYLSTVLKVNLSREGE